MDKTEEEKPKKWYDIDEDSKTMEIPDEIMPLFNKISMQIAFYEHSDKNRNLTIAHIIGNAQEFFTVKPSEAQKKADQDRVDRLYESGVYFGYPKCCINAFIKDAMENNEEAVTQRDTKNGLGFIPCTTHSTLIKAGIIKPEDLITDRVCKTPYIKEI